MPRFLFARRRTLLLVPFVLLFTACATATPTLSPTAAPTPTVVAIATNAPPPTTAPTVPPSTATPQASSTPLPSPTTEPTMLPQPSDTATRVPPKSPPATATAVPRTATGVPPTASLVPPTLLPAKPTAPPTAVPPAPPPAAFAATELITIPEGTLKMGGNANSDDADEKPFHDVHMYEYRIEKYEVTNAQYQACVAAQVCAPPVKTSTTTRPSYYGNPAFATYPVVNVTWNDAAAYCKWIGRRLPNEAEWEHAAKGTENWRYTWSNSIGMHFEWNAIFHGSPISFCEASCPLPNYWTDVNDGFAETAPVGQFSQYDSSSGFGVVDMAGNVSEWTNNWYDPDAYRDGNDIYGPADATGTKVVRGGSWADEPRRNSDRDPVAPDAASDRIGLRCAQ